LLLAFALACPLARADTLDMKDGTEMKGVVVEEYADRIVLSTADGETPLMKSGIAKLYYDDEETNLVKLGEQALDRRRYLDAVEYYGWALRLNPDSRAAKDALIFLQLHLSEREKAMVEEGLKRQDDIDKYGGYIVSEGSDAEEFEKSRRRLADSLGMALAAGSGAPAVSSVRQGSRAYDAGIRRGDTLVAIWGRLTGYIPLKDVMDRVLDKSSSEIRCTIGRTVDVALNDNRGLFPGPEAIIGASLGIEFDGLAIIKVRSPGPAAMAGLKRGDLIVAIGGASTRYMPLKKVIDIIRRSTGTIRLSIHRNIVIWKI
jgi:C-terminal processing protease CtpA/Prc